MSVMRSKCRFWADIAAVGFIFERKKGTRQTSQLIEQGRSFFFVLFVTHLWKFIFGYLPSFYSVPYEVIGLILISIHQRSVLPKALPKINFFTRFFLISSGPKKHTAKDKKQNITSLVKQAQFIVQKKKNQNVYQKYRHLCKS